MGRRAAIVGAGHTRFGALDEGPRALLRSAVDAAFASVDRGAARSQVDAAFLATLGFGGWQIGNSSAVLGEEAGITGVPTTRIENACASGGFALRAAVEAVASGASELVLVAGVEKMTDVPNARRRYWLGVSGDTEWERLAGLTFAGVYGLIASRYLADHHVGPEALAAVAVKNHENGALNPNAHFRKPVTTRPGRVGTPRRATRSVSTTAVPVSDGAAAVLVVPSRTVPAGSPTRRSTWKGSAPVPTTSRSRSARTSPSSRPRVGAAEQAFRSRRLRAVRGLVPRGP